MFHVKKPYLSSSRFLIFGVVLILFLFWYFIDAWGKAATRPWQVVSVLQEMAQTRVLTGIPGLPLSVTEPIYFVQQYWLPNAVILPTLWWRAAGLLIGLIWFSMAYGFFQWGKRYFGLWTIFLASSFFCFRWEIMWNSTYSMLTFWFVMGVGLYTYAIQHNWISQGKKVALALGALVLVSILWHGVQVKEPLAVLWGYGSLWLFLLAVWFIVWSAPTILSFLFSVILTNAEKGKSSWPALFGLTGIYLINILWLYALEAKWVDPSWVGLKPSHLFFVSLLTGGWYFSQQHQQKAEHRFPIWIGLGGAAATLGLLFWSELAWLDAWTEALAEWMTIALFWMGVAYVVHIVINFYQPIQAGLSVVKIWHQPRRIPWLLPQLGGIVACIVTISFKNGYTLDQAIAGMYFQQADYHQAAGETNLAETLYREGIQHDPYGWKGNYSLGMWAKKNQQTELAAQYFNRILQKNQEPAAAVAMAQSLAAENMFFDGLFVLQKAVRKNPDARIMTQLAYMFGQSKAWDSVQIYTERAYRLKPNRDVERTNFLAGSVQGWSKPEWEPQKTKISQGEMANWTAYARLTKQQFLFDPDTTQPQGVDRFAWVFNQALIPNAPLHAPQTWGTGMPGWEMHQRELTFARAHQAFQHGSKKEGLDILRRIILSNGANTPSLFLYTYASWLAEEGAWVRFQEDVMPWLTAEQRTQVLLGPSWEERQQKQLQTWRKEKLDAEKTSEKYPFNESILLEMVDILIKTQGKEVAYRYLVQALDYYDAPTRWWEKYVELAQSQGLNSYVMEGLDEIKKRDTERYRTLVKQYNL